MYILIILQLQNTPSKLEDWCLWCVDINVTLRLFRDHEHSDICQLLPQMNIQLSTLTQTYNNNNYTANIGQSAIGTLSIFIFNLSMMIQVDKDKDRKAR